MTKNDFLTYCEADNEYEDNDMGNRAQDFYSSYFTQAINSERGDTWFTPIALLEDVYRIWFRIEDTVNAYQQPKYGSKLKLFKLDLISKVSKILVDKVIDQDYHALANFGCLPKDLNIWRGALDMECIKKGIPERLELYNRSRLGDFPDLFFESVKSYLSEGSYIATGYNPDIEGSKLAEYDWWFKRIGGGKRCSWKEFVVAMNIEGSYVDENGQPIQLFKHCIGEPFPRLSLTKSSIDELSVEIASIPAIKDCIINIYYIWNLRAEFLSRLTPVPPHRS